jgi:hypothetical protein
MARFILLNRRWVRAIQGDPDSVRPRRPHSSAQIGGPALMKLVMILYAVIVVSLFAGLVAFQRLGRDMAMKRAGPGAAGLSEGYSTVENALFALLGLLIAFTFSGAQTRLDKRRDIVVEEANDVGTAALRLALVPPGPRQRLTAELGDYVDARIAFYNHVVDDRQASRRGEARSIELQPRLWKDAVEATRDDKTAALLLLPALNAVFDIGATRELAMKTHTPVAVFFLLALLELTCALFAGLSMAKSERPSNFHVIVFAAVLALTGALILDLEYPRMGLLRLGPASVLLAQARATIGA